MKWILLSAVTNGASAAWTDLRPPYSGEVYDRSGLTYEAFGAVDVGGNVLDSWGLAEGASLDGRQSYINSGDGLQCADACQSGVPFPDSSESYIRCHSFLDTVVPNERNKTGLAPGGTDFTGYQFRIDTNTDTPQGCTFDPVGKVVSTHTQPPLPRVLTPPSARAAILQPEPRHRRLLGCAAVLLPVLLRHLRTHREPGRERGGAR